MTQAPFLSVILPVHNEERRLPPSLTKLTAFLSAQPYPSEVIVVENGSADRTYALAQEFAAQEERVRVLREEARGKGLAVRAGMLAARGEYRMFADIDFSMPVEEIARFLPPCLDAAVSIASREAPGAVRYQEPEYRHLVGRVFNTVVRLAVLPGLQDTQCGFKCFRRDVAERVFPLQTITGWTFDVEVLAAARRMGYTIVEVPVPWHFNADSKVRVLNDSLTMALDLLRIRRNLRRGVYDGAPLRPR